jgi:hypothetical protein
VLNAVYISSRTFTPGRKCQRLQYAELASEETTSYLSTGEDNLARHEDQEHHFRFNHAIYETREKLQPSQLEDPDLRNIVNVPQARSY